MCVEHKRLKCIRDETRFQSLKCVRLRSLLWLSLSYSAFQTKCLNLGETGDEGGKRKGK